MHLIDRMLVARRNGAGPRPWLAAVLLLAVLAACADPGGNPVEPPAVAAVEVSGPSGGMRVGATMQLAATAKDAAGNVLRAQPFTWTSTSDAVATVSASGLVTSVAPGTATIRATSEGRWGDVAITITPRPVGSVTVSPAALGMIAGTTQRLAAAVADTAGGALADRPVSWASSDPSVATVAADGTVSAVGAGGPVSITASAEGRSGTASITVLPVPVAAVALEPGPTSIQVGSTAAFHVVARDAAGNVLGGRTALLVSSNADVATVAISAGAAVVTGVAPGSATLTATVEGKTATATITVVPVPVASVAIEPSSALLRVGATLALRVVARDAAGNVLAGRAATLTSSHPAVAALSASAVVTAVAPGTAVITATSEGHTGTATITVPVPAPDATPPALLAFSYTPSTLDVSEAPGTVRFTFRVSDAGAGVRFAAVRLFNPLGAQVASCLSQTPASGTTADGVYTCEMVVPRSSRAGTYTIPLVEIADDALNRREYREPELQAAGYGTTVTVVSSTADVTPPTLTAFSYTPSTLDVSAAPGTVAFTFSVADVGTGIRFVAVRLFNPLGAQVASCMAQTPASGTRNAGTYTCTATVPQSSRAGTYTIPLIEIADEADNRRDYREPELRAAGYGTTVTVISTTADVAPPTLKSFSFTPQTLDVSAGPGQVRFTFNVADAGTGVRFVAVRIFNPAGAQVASCMGDAPTSGTAADGTYSCTAIIPRNSQLGTYTIPLIELADQADNRRDYRQAELQAAGYATTVTVTN